ncbi:MAG TPA: gamma carbonic anhydrase family protein [Rhizomicrobium sp.]|jgi:carbonic anhydrase/acetyltransferase-like protein (isoleucine patch superfamily)|nr:gamma carbonic anhydrase family protein [Rhizomicrobium sp.]
MPLYAIEGIAPELPEEGHYWIAPTAVLIGRVRLLKNASVWFGAVLRGDNDWITVGENSNVQDNSIVHTDPGQPATIGSNVTIGHKVILHSTIIGDNSLIGMGSTLLNRSRVGCNCLIGANTLIAEGKEIPDNSLALGAPARVVRQLTEAQIAMLGISAQVYVDNQRRFRDGLAPAKGSGS